MSIEKLAYKFHKFYITQNKIDEAKLKTIYLYIICPPIKFIEKIKFHLRQGKWK